MPFGMDIHGNTTYTPDEPPPKPEIPWWAVPSFNIVPLPTPTYLKPGWDEKPEWGVGTAKVETDTNTAQIEVMKATRRLKNFTININDFTALLQGNCWLRCKGFPKGATVTSAFTVGNNIQLTVYHSSFPKVQVTQIPPTTPCDTKQFVRKDKKKDKVQNAVL